MAAPTELPCWVRLTLAVSRGQRATSSHQAKMRVDRRLQRVVGLRSCQRPDVNLTAQITATSALAPTFGPPVTTQTVPAGLEPKHTPRQRHGPEATQREAETRFPPPPPRP